MTNETAQTAGQTEKARKERLPLAKIYIDGEGNVIQLGAGKPVAIRLSDKTEGSDVETQEVSFAEHVAGMTANAACLFARGVRAVIDGAVNGCEDVGEAISEAIAAVEAAFSGTFSDRGGERGINYTRFAAILAHASGKSQDEILAGIKAQEEKLSDEDFAKWVSKLRGTEAYKEAQKVLFPAASNRGRKPKNLSDVLGF